MLVSVYSAMMLTPIKLTSKPTVYSSSIVSFKIRIELTDAKKGIKVFIIDNIVNGNLWMANNIQVNADKPAKLLKYKVL